jgi:DNA replication and repair protein RecF
VLTEERGAPPLMLLDDVMSELDADRRGMLVARLDDGGQAVVTTTDLGHVPGAEAAAVVRLRVASGTVVPDDPGSAAGGAGGVGDGSAPRDAGAAAPGDASARRDAGATAPGGDSSAPRAASTPLSAAEAA